MAQLQEKFTKEAKKMLEAGLKRVQQFVANVTLNPETAYPKLILSADGERVLRVI